MLKLIADFFDRLFKPSGVTFDDLHRPGFPPATPASAYLDWKQPEKPAGERRSA
jgi:hypothetical protein